MKKITLTILLAALIGAAGAPPLRPVHRAHGNIPQLRIDLLRYAGR